MHIIRAPQVCLRGSLCWVQVREALGHKVSRERVGSELQGMFTGAGVGACSA